MSHRQPTCIGLIGTRGTGKTSTTEELVQMWIRDNPTGMVYGFVPDPLSCLHKYVTIPIDGRNPNWAMPLFQITNSLILLDDYVGLMKSANGSQMYSPTPGMIDLFTRGRFSSNDIIFSCHSARSVIPALAEYTTHYVIFKTSTDEGKFNDRMFGGPKLAKAARMVNSYCMIIGGVGKHVKDPAYDGQGFPHVILNTTTGRAKPINFKKHLLKEFKV